MAAAAGYRHPASAVKRHEGSRGMTELQESRRHSPIASAGDSGSIPDGRYSLTLGKLQVLAPRFCIYKTELNILTYSHMGIPVTEMLPCRGTVARFSIDVKCFSVYQEPTTS